MKKLILFAIISISMTAHAGTAKSETCQQLVGKKFVLSDPGSANLQSIEFISESEAMTVTGYGVSDNWICEEETDSNVLTVAVNVQGFRLWLKYFPLPEPHLVHNRGLGLTVEFVVQP